MYIYIYIYIRQVVPPNFCLKVPPGQALGQRHHRPLEASGDIEGGVLSLSVSLALSLSLSASPSL